MSMGLTPWPAPDFSSIVETKSYDNYDVQSEPAAATGYRAFDTLSTSSGTVTPDDVQPPNIYADMPKLVASKLNSKHIASAGKVFKANVKKARAIKKKRELRASKDFEPWLRAQADDFVAKVEQRQDDIQKYIENPLFEEKKLPSYILDPDQKFCYMTPEMPKEIEHFVEEAQTFFEKMMEMTGLPETRVVSQKGWHGGHCFCLYTSFPEE
ncbi:hypothetical protein TWF696_008083 [Orbilia brochopaga]|uniref:Uncharacterized protein n=1 Tax=Orbilia brochopaga TaxID=3140254 RepID=A0AAV9UMF9_9PEZI